MRLLSALLLLFCLAPAALLAQATQGDQQLKAYLAAETERLEQQSLSEIRSLDDWNAKKDGYRQQLFEMLGLAPLPARTDLKATTTGTLDHPEFTVENVHFQSSPRLYVTGNLYLPKNRTEKAPAILYVCGHGGVKKNGISYGNKVHYQHHGAWYARHGYVCLVIDSLQLGEIEALHHGLHNKGMWWWPARGYTPAGVEAWNCIRALDYLQSRPEVNGEKLGVTGRSGGGAYSWWIAALDERIKVAVPVAGITDLRNHVVDGCVSGHCDCMFMNNTFAWDYPQVAALVAPRPLVISNTDSDPIFPLDGVYRTFVATRRIYELHGAKDKIAFNITSGGHKDTPELQMQAFRWFDHHLMGIDRAITKPAEPFFTMEQLQVFKKLPEDQINTSIHESFVAAAPAPVVPENKEAWEKQRGQQVQNLQERVFRAWPKLATSNPRLTKIGEDKRDNLVLEHYSFASQPHVELDLYLLQAASEQPAELVVLNVLDQAAWDEMLTTLGAKFDAVFKDEKLPPANEAAFHSLEQTLTNHRWAFAYLAPRGVGPTQWSAKDAKLTHLKRSFILLGQTHDGMSAYDVHAAIGALGKVKSVQDRPLWLQSQRQMAGVTLAAALFHPEIKRLDLYDLPPSLRQGPYFMNIQRYLDTPELVALVAEHSRVVLYQDDTTGWEYPQRVVDKLGWDKKQFQLRAKPKAE